VAEREQKATARIHSRLSLVDLAIVARFYQQDGRNYSFSSLARVAIHDLAALLVSNGMVEPVTSVAEAQAYFDQLNQGTPAIAGRVTDMSRLQGLSILSESRNTEREEEARKFLSS